MRIISLEPYITELLVAYDLASSIVGVTSDCTLPSGAGDISVVTMGESQTGPERYVDRELSTRNLNLTAMRAANPDIIIGSYYKKQPNEPVSKEDIIRIQAGLTVNIGKDVKFINYAPRTLEEIYSAQRDLSKQLKVAQKGIDYAGKVKAQVMNWADNFYDRMKNKKVSFISSVEPIKLAGFWLPDMIQTLSAHSQHSPAGAYDREVKWDDIRSYKPDVIIVAPRNYTLKESTGTFKLLEKQPGWDELPAVKRGEVIFADGNELFYKPGHSIISSMAILVSALAGFESGYITPRDSFYRLRWIELQRHKL